METRIPEMLPGRPKAIPFEAGKIYISVHDEWFLEQLRNFKRKILVSHPDRNRKIWAAGRTRKLLRLRQKFQKDEFRWYAYFGLEPPRIKDNNTKDRAGKRELLSC